MVRFRCPICFGSQSEWSTLLQHERRYVCRVCISGRYGTSALFTNRSHTAFVTQFTFKAFQALFGKTNSLLNFTRSR